MSDPSQDWYVDYKYRIGFAHGGLVVEIFERRADCKYVLVDARNLDDMEVLGEVA